MAVIKEYKLITNEELARIRAIDIWTKKIVVKICSICKGRYIPTKTSNMTCIKCFYGKL